MPVAERVSAGTLSRKAIAAPTKSRNSGAGRVGRDLNSGWNYVCGAGGDGGCEDAGAQQMLMVRVRRLARLVMPRVSMMVV